MAVRAIIFDIGKTLVHFDTAPWQERLAPCRAAAVALARRFEVGAIGEAGFRRGMCALTGMSECDFAAWWNSIFAAQWLIAPETLQKLMGRYRSGLLSNTNPLHMRYLRTRFPLLDSFAFQILSYEVGAAKPEDAIFAAAETQADCQAAEILYFDDMPEFVAAACRRGWRGEVFAGAAELPATLRRHGVE